MGIISEQISGKTITVIINSSNLESASYETEDKTLSVTFKNGTIYEYYDVPWEVFVKLRVSESQGKFFNGNISRSFKYKKVT
jgi:hypothetical protein